MRTTNERYSHISFTGRLRVLGGKGKRASDILVALFGIIIFIPIFTLIAMISKLADPGPLIYSHVRVGLGGRLFRCFKFRTMVVDAEERLDALLDADPDARAEWERSQKLTDDPRVTAVGRLLRRTSLDELPQLINVARGEMSLVGPRPVSPSELWRYGERVDLYFAARPGLTGLWQISGRSDCSYDKRIELDAKYVSEWSFSTDLSILLRTVGVVLNGRGVY